MLDNVPDEYSLTALAMIAVCVSVALTGLAAMICGNPGAQDHTVNAQSVHSQLVVAFTAWHYSGNHCVVL